MKILIAILLGSVALCAQDWIPKRIAGMTVYPAEAKRQHIMGKVEIRCFVTPDGSVAKTEVVSGHRVFLEDARKNASQWSFERNPQAKGIVADEVILVYQFVLEWNEEKRTTHDVQFVFETPNRITVTSELARVVNWSTAHY